MTQAANDTPAPLLTLDNLSYHTGASAEQLSEWQALGLVGAPDA